MKIEDYPKFTIIMRGYSFEEDRAILSAMKGLENQFAVEVTMNTPGAAGTIKRLNDEFGKKLIIGAGTVLSFEDEIEAKVNRDLADSRIISLVKSIQDLQRESKKLRTESEEENENE